MANLAYAQQAVEGGGPGPLLQFLPLIMVMAIFYFLLIRPQQQKVKAHRTMVDNLKRNDRVMTNGGIYGRVTEVGEREVTLEIAPNVKIQVDRLHVETLVGGGKSSGGGGTEKNEGKGK
ncbi:MAG: preprotein translocase subunit YajC [Candidatus Binatia bacterium]